jgi:hypothetical protein
MSYITTSRQKCRNYVSLRHLRQFCHIYDTLRHITTHYDKLRHITFTTFFVIYDIFSTIYRCFWRLSFNLSCCARSLLSIMVNDVEDGLTQVHGVLQSNTDSLKGILVLSRTGTIHLGSRII